MTYHKKFIQIFIFFVGINFLLNTTAKAQDEDFFKVPGGNGLLWVPEYQTNITIFGDRLRPDRTFGFGAHGGSWGGGTSLPTSELLKEMRKNMHPNTVVGIMETCRGAESAADIASGLNKPIIAPNDDLWIMHESKSPGYLVGSTGRRGRAFRTPPDEAFTIFYPDGRSRPVNANNVMNLFKKSKYRTRLPNYFPKSPRGAGGGIPGAGRIIRPGLAIAGNVGLAALELQFNDMESQGDFNRALLELYNETGNNQYAGLYYDWNGVNITNLTASQREDLIEENMAGIESPLRALTDWWHDRDSSDVPSPYKDRLRARCE